MVLSQDSSLLLFSSVGRYSAPLGADLYYSGADLHSQGQRSLSCSSPQKRDFFLRAIGHHHFLFCPQLPIAEIMLQMNLVVRWEFPFAKPLLMDWRLYLGQRTADNIWVFTTLSLAHEERQAEKSSGYCTSLLSAQVLKWGCHSEKERQKNYSKK